LTSVKDISAHPLIQKIAKDLKEKQGVKMPEFAVFVKTGPHKERAPEEKDWWFIRMASILRRTYVDGHVNVNSLRSYYGGKKRRGVKPAIFKKAGGKIIRVCLQDLEKLGFVKISDDKKGRVITTKGQKYLDKIATDLLKEQNNNIKTKFREKIPIKEKTHIKEDTPKEKNKKDKI
jgi:small subunit ribosomal protein S19e